MMSRRLSEQPAIMQIKKRNIVHANCAQWNNHLCINLYNVLICWQQMYTIQHVNDWTKKDLMRLKKD